MLRSEHWIAVKVYSYRTVQNSFRRGGPSRRPQPDPSSKYFKSSKALPANPRAIRWLKLAHLAQYDFLTDLPNRLLLGDRIANAIALARRHGKQRAVLFLDLDGF
jgi:diguanylate cyclase with GGDEF domain